jgi:hypothetical protein
MITFNSIIQSKCMITFTVTPFHFAFAAAVCLHLFLVDFKLQAAHVKCVHMTSWSGWKWRAHEAMRLLPLWPHLNYFCGSLLDVFGGFRWLNGATIPLIYVVASHFSELIIALTRLCDIPPLLWFLFKQSHGHTYTNYRFYGTHSTNLDCHVHVHLC